MRRKGVALIVYELWFTDDRGRVVVERVEAFTDLQAAKAARAAVAAHRRARAAQCATLGFTFRCRKGWYQLQALRNVDLDTWVIPGKN